MVSTNHHSTGQYRNKPFSEARCSPQCSTHISLWLVKVLAWDLDSWGVSHSNLQQICILDWKYVAQPNFHYFCIVCVNLHIVNWYQIKYDAGWAHRTCALHDQRLAGNSCRSWEVQKALWLTLCVKKLLDLRIIKYDCRVQSCVFCKAWTMTFGKISVNKMLRSWFPKDHNIFWSARVNSIIYNRTVHFEHWRHSM